MNSQSSVPKTYNCMLNCTEITNETYFLLSKSLLLLIWDEFKREIICNKGDFTDTDNGEFNPYKLKEFVKARYVYDI